MTHALLLLDDHRVALLARIFYGPVRGLAIDDKNLVNPFGFDLRHEDHHAVDFVQCGNEKGNFHLMYYTLNVMELNWFFIYLGMKEEW